PKLPWSPKSTDPAQQTPGRERGPGAGQPAPPNIPRRTWLIFLVLLLANYLLMRSLFNGPDSVTIPYTVFKEQVAAGNVETIYAQGEEIEGRFAEPITWPPEGQTQERARPSGQRPAAPQAEPREAETFTTVLPAFVDPGLERFLIDHDVEISAVPIDTGGSGWA